MARANSQAGLRLVPPTGLPALLRAERARRGFTQAEVARRFDVQTQTIGQWERGAKAPQPRFHSALADFLGLGSAQRVRRLLRDPVSLPNSPSGADEPKTLEPRASNREPGTGPSPSDMHGEAEVEIRRNVSRYLASLGTRASPEELEVARSLLHIR